jgi:hypothetical protein
MSLDLFALMHAGRLSSASDRQPALDPLNFYLQ